MRWLEALERPPEILANEATETTGYKLYVPDNVGDIVAKQWSSGKYFDSKNHPIDIAGYRTEKNVRPLHLPGDAVVHYIWDIEDEECEQHCKTLATITRSLTQLGWGIDLVVTDFAVEEPSEIKTLHHNHHMDRWLPVETPGGSALRTPVPGTLEALVSRHAAFLGRLPTREDGTQFFRPVPPLTQYNITTYRRERDLAQPPYAIFALRKPDDSGFATFDPKWRRLHLSGMLRHAASQPGVASALGWDKIKVDTFILGHDNRNPSQPKPTVNTPRLVFVPLPSIVWRGEDHGNTIGSIRRVLVTISGYVDPNEFRQIVRALEGLDLVDERSKQIVAFLRKVPDKDHAIAGYLGNSSVWTTVTPVVLPGHDDRGKLRQRLREKETSLTAEEKAWIVCNLDSRIERLLRKAIVDAGFPSSLVANADLQWRETGFLQGADLSSHYSVPEQCRRYRRLHVRIVWREKDPHGILHPKRISGPFCIGAGRFFGLGLFVPVTT